jgi:hypothetical protein
MNEKTLLAKPKGIFGQIRRDIFYVVKDTITTHYRAGIYFHYFGVNLCTVSKIFGGPYNQRPVRYIRSILTSRYLDIVDTYKASYGSLPVKIKLILIFIQISKCSIWEY